MHMICYVILFVANTLGAAAYGGLFWNAFAINPNASEPTVVPDREVVAAPAMGLATI